MIYTFIFPKIIEKGVWNINKIERFPKISWYIFSNSERNFINILEY